MAVTMLDKQAEKTEKSQWPADIRQKHYEINALDSFNRD